MYVPYDDMPECIQLQLLRIATLGKPLDILIVLVVLLPRATGSLQRAAMPIF